jgi:AcrR family transcriptional regulator
LKTLPDTSPSERQRVLDAITELCAIQGYEATTVGQVIERSDISREGFYGMFSSKEECMLAAEYELVGEVMTAVAASYSADRSDLENGLFGMKAILELMAANPSFAFCGYIGCRQMAPRRIREAQETGAHMLAAMIDRLRGEYSETLDQPASAARASLGGGQALVRQEIMAGRTDQLPRLLPDLAYGATVAFLGQEEALQLSRRARELLRGTAWE